MKDRWIIVPKWERFQSYKARDPSWIKLYTRLNSHDEWLGLSTAARGMLTTIWVEYPRSGGLLRVEKVMQLCGKSARSKHLEALNHAGFIEISSSKPRALTRARARSREKEKETDTPLPIAKSDGGLDESLDEELLRDVTPRQRGTNPRAKGTNPRVLGINPRELARYTGCRWVRGQIAATHKYDPLGTDKPPANWPYEKPSKAEILDALDARKRDEELSEMAQRQFEDEVEAAAEEINF